jgi:hypothetical protein
MGQYFPENDHCPLEDQVKNLGDDELLDFWEETQFLGKIASEYPVSIPAAQLHYERIILQELLLRSCMRGAGPR